LSTEKGKINQRFVLLPTNKQYLQFFDAVEGAVGSTDVIYSHTHMFKSEDNNEENVKSLADKCTNYLYQLVKNNQQ